MKTAPGSGAPALQTLAAFAAGLRSRDVPAAVLAKARTCVLDVLWGCLHVHHDPRAKAALRIIALDQPGAGAHILTTQIKAGAVDAAFVGAVACAATDRSDTHLPSATHPGIVIVPAVLAAVEEAGGSGEDVLRGVIAGYEIMGRLARALVTPGFGKIYRTTAVTAPTAAAMAVATALGLDERAVAVAGSLASHTSIGFNEWARAGAGEHVFHAGTAARNAVLAAKLAGEGVEATMTALDGPSGLLAGYDALSRVVSLTDGLGERYELDVVAFKPAPACFFAQTPAQVAAAAAAEIDPDDIEAIEVRVSRTAAEFPGCAVASGLSSVQAAVMSIPFAVASTLRAGRIDADAWTRFDDPSLAALAARCVVVSDERLTAAYPGRSGAALRVQLRSRGPVEAFRDDFVSMTEAEVSARFSGDARRLVGEKAAQAVPPLAQSLADLPEAGILAAACGGPIVPNEPFR